MPHAPQLSASVLVLTQIAPSPAGQHVKSPQQLPLFAQALPWRTQQRPPTQLRLDGSTQHSPASAHASPS
jgi:hypothetical protein